MEKSQALAETRDRETQFDRQRFADELTHLLNTPGYTTDKSALKERGLEEFKMEDKAKTEPLEELLKEELEAINDALASTGETFMLGSPETLTVKRPNGAFSKKAHIGSEDFKPVRAYLGKRGKIIFVFKPVMVADYDEMEMDENQAKEKLIGFKEWFKDKAGDLQGSIADKRAHQALEQDKAAMAKRADEYAHLGFGEW
jgi:hypothetical protein